MLETHQARSRRPVGLFVGAVAFHMFVYYGTQLINNGFGRTYYNLAIPLDDMIPFVPAFVSFYILAYIQWGLTYLFLFFRDPELFRRAAWATIFSEIVVLVFFLALPTRITWPDASGDGFFLWLTRIIYSSDEPTNLFPSLHCLQSWICWRAMRKHPGFPRWASALHLIFTLLVCASTVFIKQHYFLDIPFGILFAELGWQLVRLLVRRREAAQ